MFRPIATSFRALFFTEPAMVQCVARCSVRGDWRRAVRAIDSFRPLMEITATAGGCSAFEGALYLDWEELGKIDPNGPMHFRLELEREGGLVKITLPLELTANLQVELLLNAGQDFAVQYALSSKLHAPANKFANQRLDKVLERIRPPFHLEQLSKQAPGLWKRRVQPIVAYISTLPNATKSAIIKAIQERCVISETKEFTNVWKRFCVCCKVDHKWIPKKRICEAKLSTMGARRLQCTASGQIMLMHKDVSHETT